MTEMNINEWFTFLAEMRNIGLEELRIARVWECVLILRAGDHPMGKDYREENYLMDEIRLASEWEKRYEAKQILSLLDDNAETEGLDASPLNMEKEFKELRELLLSIDSKHFTWDDARTDVLSQLGDLQSKAENLPLSDVSDLLREDEIRETFYAGFDEGYTNPLERDGKIITEDEYEAERKRNYFQWLNNR